MRDMQATDDVRVRVRKRKAAAVAVPVPKLRETAALNCRTGRIVVKPTEAAGMTCFFTVAGPPVGKKRPRVTKNGTFTPAETRAYERTVHRFCQLLIPRNWPLDRRYRLHVAFTGRSDGDNVFKSVADALEGVAYANDRQVDKGSHERLKGGHPRTEVTIEVLP